MLKETLKLTHAAKGANVILCIPNDESLFEDAVQPAPGIFCTSPIVTYLDLCTAATIETVRPPTIWPRSAFHGYERATIRR